MTPQPKTCGECRPLIEKVDGYSTAYGVELCPRHAAATDLYEAAKRTAKYSTGEGNERNFWLAIKALRAAIKQYEGK